MTGILCVSESPEPGVESASELSSGIKDHPRPSVCLEDVKSSPVVLTFFLLTDGYDFPGWRIQPKPEAKPATAVIRSSPRISSRPGPHRTATCSFNPPDVMEPVDQAMGGDGRY